MPVSKRVVDIATAKSRANPTETVEIRRVIRQILEQSTSSNGAGKLVSAAPVSVLVDYFLPHVNAE